MAAPPSPHSAVLVDELVEDCLLRLPPEDPADLARAALVSRQWHRVVTGAVFRRRYMELHRSPPLLGYFVNLDSSVRFVPTSSFRPPQAARLSDVVRAVHSRHGRVLLHSSGRDREGGGLRLLVWDPRKDKQWELPVLQPGARINNWDAALVCAVGDGCSHLDCHFKVVLVGRSAAADRRFFCFYSSEPGSWSDPIFASEKEGFQIYYMLDSVVVGNDFYMGCFDRIFKLDLQTHQICSVSRSMPPPSLLIATDDGSMLGIAETMTNLALCVSLREQGGWVQSRLIQLRGLLPDDALCNKPFVVGFEETGAGVIFLRTCVGYFAIDLNSGRSTKVGNVLGSGRIVPYKSFCAPASGTVSANEGSGASVVATDDEPGAGVVVSRDEG